MNTKTDTLVSTLKAGPTLNALVALAQGWIWNGKDSCWMIPVQTITGDIDFDAIVKYQPSINGAQAFELIEKFKTDIDCDECLWTVIIWPAYGLSANVVKQKGTTTAEAICKSVVASKYGDTIPDDVMESLK